MEGCGPTYSNHLGRSGKHCIGARECRSTLWMGHALDLVGSFRRRIGSQPDSLRLSVDSYNRFIFRRQNQSKPGETRSSRLAIPRRTIVDKLSPGLGGGSYGKPHGSGASESNRIGACCRCFDLLCHKSLRILGLATSPEPHKRSVKVIRWILWHTVHGIDFRCSGGPMFGTFCAGFAHLGGKYGQPLVGLSHLLHTQSGVGHTTLFPRDVLREFGKVTRIG